MTRAVLLIITCLTLVFPAYGGVDGTVSLQETVEKAVKHHPQIKSLRHNQEAMSQNLYSAIGEFFPSLDLTAEGGFQQYSSSTTREAGSEDRHRTATDSTLTLTQNVFDGLERYNTYKGSQARLTSAEYRLIDNIETVALDAIRAHIDVVRERKLVALAGDNITQHQEVLDSIAERVAGGAGSLADEMQARGRVARAETTLITYNGNLLTAEAEYKRNTGMAPGPLGDPEFMLEALIPGTMDTVMDKTLVNNPKIKVFSAEVDAAEKDKKISQSTYFPTVDVELSTRNNNHLDGSDTYLQDNRAMLALSWNLFNGTSDYHNTKRDIARVHEAEANLMDTTDDLTRQVATAWSEYITAVNSIEKHMEALSYSMESRDMYLMQFNVGQRSLLDVLDAINEVFTNNVQLETAQFNRSFTLYKLLTLEGRLVNSLESAKAEAGIDSEGSIPMEQGDSMLTDDDLLPDDSILPEDELLYEGNSMLPEEEREMAPEPAPEESVNPEDLMNLDANVMLDEGQ